MAYRDENDALRARLEATEDRLRETESALVEANRRADVAQREARSPRDARATRDARKPVAAAPSDNEHVYVRSVALFWMWVGVAFVAWQLIQEANHGMRGIAQTVLATLVLFAAPSILVLRRTARARPARADRSLGRTGGRVRVAAPEQHAVAVEPIDDASLDLEITEAPARKRRRLR